MKKECEAGDDPFFSFFSTQTKFFKISCKKYVLQSKFDKFRLRSGASKVESENEMLKNILKTQTVAFFLLQFVCVC